MQMQTSGPIAELEEAQTTARRVFSLIASEMLEVEAEFVRQARSNIQVIAYIGDYLRSSGGKRVRPALTILSNYAVGGDGSRQSSIRMATVMEFLHTATLVHDDIIDNAETRRNRPSVNTRFGNQTAVLMGDWLYMSAFETSLDERSIPILDNIVPSIQVASAPVSTINFRTTADLSFCGFTTLHPTYKMPISLMITVGIAGTDSELLENGARRGERSGRFITWHRTQKEISR